MTFITKRTIPRRAVLRGLGASVALPFLDGMVPGLSARAAAGPVRFGAVYVPNGMVMQNWTPAATGAGFELTPILEPLAPFRDELLCCRGSTARRRRAFAAAATRAPRPAS